jgi:hypothetical protein
MHRWREIEKDRRKNDRDARETAINALRHRPLEIVGLAVQTYMGWDIGTPNPFGGTPESISVMAS